MAFGPVQAKAFYVNFPADIESFQDAFSIGRSTVEVAFSFLELIVPLSRLGLRTTQDTTGANDQRITSS